jgi:ABC-type sugar transport system ATPase subunit
MASSSMSRPPLIEVRNLSKSFPGVKALDHVRFDLMAGEVHALMGENGAGKSTLMKILAGVYRMDGGEVLLDGVAVDIQSPAHAQALAIGIIHQELHLMPHLSAAQNIFLGREPRKAGGWLLDEARLNEDARALFDRLNLRMEPTTRIADLTVAKQQMVEIAKALSFKSRVLIMDEPTAALNNAEIEELFRIIRQLKQEGVGVVYISHKMDEIQRIADRITVMRDGSYIDTVPSQTPMSQPCLGLTPSKRARSAWRARLCACAHPKTRWLQALAISPKTASISVWPLAWMWRPISPCPAWPVGYAGACFSTRRRLPRCPGGWWTSCASKRRPSTKCPSCCPAVTSKRW